LSFALALFVVLDSDALFEVLGSAALSEAAGAAFDLALLELELAGGGVPVDLSGVVAPGLCAYPVPQIRRRLKATDWSNVFMGILFFVYGWLSGQDDRTTERQNDRTSNQHASQERDYRRRLKQAIQDETTGQDIRARASAPDCRT
jgi:hypothetical protein